MKEVDFFKFLNKCLHESVLLHPVILLIIFFIILKIFVQYEEFPQIVNPQFMIFHNSIPSSVFPVT